MISTMSNFLEYNHQSYDDHPSTGWKPTTPSHQHQHHTDDQHKIMKLLVLNRNETDYKTRLSSAPPVSPSKNTSHRSFRKTIDDVTKASVPSTSSPSITAAAETTKAASASVPLIGPTVASSFAQAKMPFPWKLHQLLDDVDRSSPCVVDRNGSRSNQWNDVVSWMPDGNSFRVHQPDAFAGTIMRRYFKMSKYTSFTRQLYIYGFSKIEGGICHGAFFHPKFVRGDRDPCFTIGRNQSGDRRLKSAAQRRIKTQMVFDTDCLMRHQRQKGQEQQQYVKHSRSPRTRSLAFEGQHCVRDGFRTSPIPWECGRKESSHPSLLNTIPDDWLAILEPRPIEEMSRNLRRP